MLTKAGLEDDERFAQKAAAKAEEETEAEAADTANVPALSVPDLELMYAEELGQLASMGFPSRSQNVSALRQASGDVQTAMDWLLAQPASQRLFDRSQQRPRRADALQGQASADSADFVEAAENAEWEKVEVRRPLEAVFSSKCGPLRAVCLGLGRLTLKPSPQRRIRPCSAESTPARLACSEVVISRADAPPCRS